MKKCYSKRCIIDYFRRILLEPIYRCFKNIYSYIHVKLSIFIVTSHLRKKFTFIQIHSCYLSHYYHKAPKRVPALFSFHFISCKTILSVYYQSRKMVFYFCIQHGECSFVSYELSYLATELFIKHFFFLKTPVRDAYSALLSTIFSHAFFIQGIESQKLQKDSCLKMNKSVFLNL